MKRWLALLLLFASSAHAQDAGVAPAPEPEEQEEALPEGHEPEIAVRVDTGHGVRTGDLLHVTITATVPAGDDVTVPRQSPANKSCPAFACAW
jgi:hypothetical protein